MSFLTVLVIGIGLRAGVQSAYLDGQGGRSSAEQRVQVGAQYYERNEVYGEWARLARTYSAQAKARDVLWTMGHVAAIENFYLVTEGEWSRDPSFSPKWGFFLQPRIVLPIGTDFGLGYRYRKYSEDSSSSFVFDISQPVGHFLTLGFRLDAILHPNRATAAQASFKFFPESMFGFDVRGAGGKSDEGEGILDDFEEVAAVLHLRVMRLDFQAEYIRHSGDIRRENRFGGGVGCRF